MSFELPLQNTTGSSPETARPREIPQTEMQRADTVANSFYDMAETARTEEEKYPLEYRYKEELFSGAGRETAQGNYAGAQRLLEANKQWNDDLRKAASEINQLDLRRRGAKPLTFAEAQAAIRGYARDLETSEPTAQEPESDRADAAKVDEIVNNTSRSGVEGVDEALNYIESSLKGHVNLADFTSYGKGKETTEDWRKKRAIRDALFQEKQLRLEQQKKSQQAVDNKTSSFEPRRQTVDNLSEQPVYENITDGNLDQYSHQKDIAFDGRDWRIDEIFPDGRVVLNRDISLTEALDLAERAIQGNLGGATLGNINTPNAKTKAKMIGRTELTSRGKWILERPPRSQQNMQRQKEVDEARQLRERLMAGEFSKNKYGEFELLEETYIKTAHRLNQEKEDYEKKTKK